MLQVAKEATYLTKDGKPFFYLGDTCWSAFTNISDGEWAYYLNKRKAQGFNVLQINILPQWDASQTELNYEPFKLIDGKWDYFSINESYFEHARSLCQKAKEQGFELALVVLWSNYVPDTWASKFYDRGILKKEALDAYIEMVDRTFSDLDPIYIISGDTDFQSELCESYYIDACRKLKAKAPHLLYTTHIKGRYSYIPQGLEQQLDFLMFQSGHNHKDLSMPYTLPQEMAAKYPGKPLINAEPCYEEMGYSGGENGQWTKQDIRRAAYESLLSGAGAGITYGAAGIYSWHTLLSEFASEIGEGFARPKPWQEALQFPGAWDYGFIHSLWNTYGLYDLVPAQELLLSPNPRFRISKAHDGTILIYTPYNSELKLQLDSSLYEGIEIDLENRYVSTLELKAKDFGTYIEKTYFHNDVFYILKRKK